ncbi:potassium transporter TrkA [Halorubellus sp. JP-L1]|uniref:potassium channel family protein n=1 Tax=Halorubellus sp. JP-L1 TaxID=2715753 RepID=UPI001407D58F|nr:TrkA C-terminal domain-containing protein [Halorubellus sp. JP-L1]NHN41146.1 potassium transporter TrkA [Halorubellus sp. JP-L1]
MASLPVEFLFGVYLGLLTGIVPAFVSGALGFAFKYFTGVTLPGLGVVVLSVAIAGINGGLMGLLDPAVASSPRVVTAAVVVMMLSLYAHSQGDRLGVTLPKRFSLRRLRERTLSGEALDVFGGVTVTVTDTVGDVEGYPPLPADLRSRIAESTWSFPGDLPLSELELRLAERLKTEFDLADASVTVDSRGRATVAAAPPTGGLSRTVPKGKRAVSVAALLPTGVARGDTVIAQTSTGPVTGTVVSARTTGDDPPEPRASLAPVEEDVLTDGGADAAEASVATPTAPTTDGGEGRVTLAVDRADAAALLRASRARVHVTSRGTHREYELVSLLRRAGNRFRRVTVRADGALDGTTIGEAGVRDAYGVAVLAVRESGTSGGATPKDGSSDRRWAFSPTGSVALSAGDELFVVGRPDALAAFVEAAA